MALSVAMVRSAFFNTFGQMCLLAIGLVSTPILFHRLGSDAYGIFSIALVIMGYSNLCDLGIGAASVKFVAERLAARRYDDVTRLVSTALVSNATLGLAGAGLLWLTASPLVNYVLRVPAVFRPQATSALMLIAGALPLWFVGAVFEGTLTTIQRFDVLSGVRIGSGVIKASLAVALVLAGFGATGAVFATVVAQVLSGLVLAIFAVRLVPGLRIGFHWARDEFRGLLHFGSWVTVSSVIAPFFLYLDRFFLAALVSMSAVGYYSVSYNAVMTLLVVPLAISPVVFPVFATLRPGSTDRGTLSRLYSHSIQYVVVAMVPIVTVVVAFAHEILRVWMGNDVALHSSLVMQVLALGVLARAVAQIPYALIQASGRPDLTAKFHLCEILPYAAMCVWLVPRGGAPAAALVWALRSLVDATLLVFAAGRILGVSLRASCRRVFDGWTLLLTGGFALGTAVVWNLRWSTAPSICFISIILGFYFLGAWRHLLLPATRQYERVGNPLGYFGRVGIGS